MIKVDILAIGVHPDDIELSCAGTLLSHAARGYTFGLLDLTRGELGTRGTPEIRAREADAAARKLGAKFRENLDLPDAFVAFSRESITHIVTAIRDCQPEIVLANALADRHPDHGRAGKLIADACYYSGLRKIETTDINNRAQEVWRPKAVYHYMQDRNYRPDFVVDITGYFDRKVEAIACYKSQFNDHEKSEHSNEPTTPISGMDFQHFLRAKAENFGREAGFDLAEAYQVDRYPGVSDLFSLT